jgi:hypothetical protein
MIIEFNKKIKPSNHHHDLVKFREAVFSILQRLSDEGKTLNITIIVREEY